jgi:hypothetical protein
MLLRSTLEKHIPLKENEVHLSDDARTLVFRGSYILPSIVSDVRSEQNYDRRSRNAYPFKVIVERKHSNGTVSIAGDSWDSMSFSDPSDAVTELATPDALKRATRIERLARKIKATAACVTVAAIAGLGVYSASNNNESGPVTTSATPCEEVVSGNETLVGVGSDLPEQFADTDQVWCSIGDNTFVVAEPRS